MSAKKGQKRDMWKNIPWKRRAAIVKKAHRMPDGLRKTVVLLAFEEGLSTAEIAKAAEHREGLTSRNHRPISKRRALQIIAEEVPDYNAYQKKHPKEHPRKDHFAFIWRNQGKKVRCALCESAENLEWHHMIPEFLGGTAEPENMVCLCHDCHVEVTNYQHGLFPEQFENGAAQKEG